MSDGALQNSDIGFDPSTDLSSQLGTMESINPLPEGEELQDMLNRARNHAYSTLLVHPDAEVQAMAEMLLAHEMMMGMGAMSILPMEMKSAAKEALISIFQKTKGFGSFLTNGIINLLKGGVSTVAGLIPGLNVLAKPAGALVGSIIRKPVEAVVGAGEKLLGGAVNALTGGALREAMRRNNAGIPLAG
jgi:hypothetical protein